MIDFVMVNLGDFLDEKSFERLGKMVDNDRDFYIPSESVLNEVNGRVAGKARRVFDDFGMYLHKRFGIDIGVDCNIPMDVVYSVRDNYADVPMKIVRCNDSYDVPFEIVDRRDFRD